MKTNQDNSEVDREYISFKSSTAGILAQQEIDGAGDDVVDGSFPLSKSTDILGQGCQIIIRSSRAFNFISSIECYYCQNQSKQNRNQSET